jgi:hypothetical protein
LTATDCREKSKVTPRCGPDRFCALNARIFFLRDTDHDDPLVHRPTHPIPRHDVVFPLPALKRDQRDLLRSRRGLDRADEAIKHGREQRRRGNGMPPVIPEEVTPPEVCE